MFGDYGTFLPVQVRHPSTSSCPTLQACAASKPPFEKSYGKYDTGHDTNETGEATTKSKTSYDELADLDDSLAEFTLYEAKTLRQSADRLKTAGDGVEVTEIYLHAGLKFLKSAYLLECRTIPGLRRPKGTPDAFHCYIDAAKLFRYCAETSEKSGKIEIAVLSYKCMEVTHLRVAFGLKNICSTSKSLIYEKDIKMSSHLKPTNDTVSHLRQLLSISEHTASAMNASKRYRALELAIRHHSCTEGYRAESLSSVKKALDFSFYNVEEFVRLITLSLKDVGM
uniref:Uncharacterized protein LOC105041589 n=2 Tax=Elaeis guineensis var. tenera TaxID=51953 RepID=A0A8N4F3E6_ELAGV|nr:uncharacterized protein LOC105041589 [Elaeis guineensis]